MGVFSRFLDIVNANINALLDKAEDPEKMVRLMLQEVEDTLIELKSACAGKLATKTSLERNIKEVEELISRWMHRAELAMENGREALAREALAEKIKAQAELQRLKERREYYDQLIAKSKEDIERLEEKLRSLRQKYQVIAERAARGREEHDDRSSSAKTSAYEWFDHLEQRIDRMKANTQGGGIDSDAEDKFAKAEQNDAIEAELEQLRKKVQK